MACSCLYYGQASWKPEEGRAAYGAPSHTDARLSRPCPGKASVFHHGLPSFLHWCSLLLTCVEEREISEQLRPGVYSLDNVGQAVLQLCCKAQRKPVTLVCLANLCICERDMLLLYVRVCCLKSNYAVLFQQESLPVKPTSSSCSWSHQPHGSAKMPPSP